MDDLDATILRALASNDPSMIDDSGMLGEDEFLEQLLKVTGSSQEIDELPSSSSFDIEPIEFFTNQTQSNGSSANHGLSSNQTSSNLVIKPSTNANLADKNDGGTHGLMDFLALCETQFGSGFLEDDPFEPVPIKPKRERRKRRSVPNLTQARLPAVEFIRNASIAMQPSRNGMDDDFIANSRKLDMFLQENNGQPTDTSEMTEKAAPATTGKRRREHNQGRNSLPTMHIGATVIANSSNTQRPPPLLSEADLEGLDLTDYEDNEGDEIGPQILDQAPLFGINGGSVNKFQDGETHSMHERLLRISGDTSILQMSSEPPHSGGRVRRLSGGSLGGVEERLKLISVDNVEDNEASVQRIGRAHAFSHQSSMGETHSMEERLRRISTESFGSTGSEPRSSPDRLRFTSGGGKHNSPTHTAETHSMEERLRRISADGILISNAAGVETHSMEERLRRISADGMLAVSSTRAETHSMEERLRRISAEAGNQEKDLFKRGGSVASSHSETHSMEERLRRISESNRKSAGGSLSAEDRVRRVSGESSRSLSTSNSRGNSRGLNLSPKLSEGRKPNQKNAGERLGFNADLIEKCAKFDLFLATRGEDVTAPTMDESEDHPAPKRRKSLEQQRSSLPPMHISTEGSRPMPLLSKTDLADLDLSDFEDSTDDDTLMSSNDKPIRFAVNLEKKGADRRKALGKRSGRQNSLPDLHALATDSSKSGSKDPPRRSESSSPVDHDPLGLFGRLKNLMKRTEKTQVALQEWDKLHGLPKSHSQTMVNSSRSRRQIQEGRIIPKWDGTPLINEETELGRPKPRAKSNKTVKK